VAEWPADVDDDPRGKQEIGAPAGIRDAAYQNFAGQKPPLAGIEHDTCRALGDAWTHAEARDRSGSAARGGVPQRAGLGHARELQRKIQLLIFAAQLATRRDPRSHVRRRIGELVARQVEDIVGVLESAVRRKNGADLARRGPGHSKVCWKAALAIPRSGT